MLFQRFHHRYICLVYSRIVSLIECFGSKFALNTIAMPNKKNERNLIFSITIAYKINNLGSTQKLQLISYLPSEYGLVMRTKATQFATWREN